MEWHFVGRTQLLETIRRALRDSATGPFVIAGERGSGRTSLVERLIESPEAARYHVVRIVSSDTPADVAARAGDGPGALLVVDDAHLCDHASLLALRELARRRGAAIVATTLAGTPDRRPDPTDCLRFEPGARTLVLQPLTVEEVAALLSEIAGGHVRQATAAALHSASRGNAALLHDLLVGRGLVDRLTRGTGGWELRQVPRWQGRPRRQGTRHLVEATWDAWRGRAFDRAFELCKAAAWCGEEQLVAVPMAHLLLLRGRPLECLRFLDSLGTGAVETTPHLALARALALANGLGKPQAAADFLLRAALAGGVTRPQPLYLAYRAWIMALTGLGTAEPASVDRDDRETALFVHAAQAMAELRLRSERAVFHLRRALALVSGGMEAGPPWLSPHLTACLIDALLLAGRSSEATLLAANFHAAEPASGWEVVSVLAA